MSISEKVKHIMSIFNLSLNEVAKYLGITTQSLRNKINRDSFSIRDLIIIAHMCDANLNMKLIAYDEYEVEPIIFGFDSLSKDDVQRVEQLDYEKAKYSIENLSTWLPKLPIEEQEKIIKELQFLKDRVDNKNCVKNEPTE